MAKECDIFSVNKGKIPIETHPFTREKIIENRVKNDKFSKESQDHKMSFKSKERKIVCFTCGDEHFAQVCPKKIVKSNPKNESPTSPENNKISLIIHGGSAKNYTCHPLSISDLQNLNIFIDNELKSALLDSGATIVVLNKQVLTKKKTAISSITLTSCSGDRKKKS